MLSVSFVSTGCFLQEYDSCVWHINGIAVVCSERESRRAPNINGNDDEYGVNDYNPTADLDTFDNPYMENFGVAKVRPLLLQILCLSFMK